MNLETFKKDIESLVDDINYQATSGPYMTKNILAIKKMASKISEFYSKEETKKKIREAASNQEREIKQQQVLLKELTSQYDEQEKEYEQFITNEKQILTQKEKIEVSVKNLQNIRETIEQLKSDIKFLKDKNLDKLRSEKQKLENKLRHEKKNELLLASDLQKLIHTLNPNLSSLDEKLKKELQKGKEELDKYVRQIGIQKNEIRDLERSNKDLGTELNSLKQQKETLLKKVKLLKEESQQIGTDYQKANESFSAHLASNLELWDIVKENYAERELELYVENELKKTIQDGLKRFDDILTGIVSDIQSISI